MDRDDTLIKDSGYINDPDQVKLLPGSAEALVELRHMGYKLIVVTNQSGIARGILTEKVLEQIHRRLEKLLAQKGAHIDKIYYCPYHPDGAVEKYRRDSDMRKPNPGMILAAASQMDIDLQQSWMIGNSYRDITAGQRAGCGTILINSTIDQTYRKPTDPVPDKEAVNMKEAVNIIKMFNRRFKTPPKPAPQPETTQSTPEVNHAPAQKETHRLHTPQAQQPTPTAGPDKEVRHERAIEAERTNRLLEEILRHVKEMQREGMFEEFSMAKVIAGVIQALVLLCLFLSLLFLMDHTKSAGSVHTTIGYAIVLQLMVIALYMMRDRK